MNKIKIFFIIVLIFFNSCTKNQNDISIIKENKQDLELRITFEDAYQALNLGDAYFAANRFLEAELLFPQSEWAPRAALMASYSYYLQNYYSLALSNLERFLKIYPDSNFDAYAHYLIAMCYYETIEDEMRNSEPIFRAKEKFLYVQENFPNTDFALDAEFKLDLIEDMLAAKEMYLARYYLKRKNWIASMNRFKNVIEKYNKTIFVEEALHRLVEINYKLGLIKESNKYANILGYNYQSGDWYKKSYKVLNKDYKFNKNDIKKDKKGMKKIFKKLFD